MRQLLTTLLLLGILTSTSYAQDWDNGDDDSWDNSGDDDSWDNSGDDASKDTDKGYDYDAAAAGGGTYDDSTSGDDGWGDWDDGGDDYGGGGFGDVDVVRSARPAIQGKPYERFTGMPYDSATELITYVEVVEIIIPDRFFDLGGEVYDGPDSLQARAEKWMRLQFGEKEAKKMVEDAGIDEKGREGNTINAVVVMPLVIEKNKYSKVNNGVLQFDMELRFKEGRYRYKFENFVHLTPAPTGSKTKLDKTYLEYYMTARKDIRANDQILIACNTTMTRLIDGLKQSCDAIPFMDDDDW